MKKVLSFDDVLIVPRFSNIKSRKDVNLVQNFLGRGLASPFISSNMDSVTGPKMANAMWENSAVGALHRFCSIEDNVKMYKESTPFTIVSIGLGEKERQRAEALYEAGANNFLIDVAQGASMEVVNQFNLLKQHLHGINIIVGNFATAESIKSFKYHCKRYTPDAYKIGIGGGSACLTRVVTGCGLPTFASIQDCATTGEVLIADGGIRNSGDAVKALAAGASIIMAGKLFAGCDESPGLVFYKNRDGYDTPIEQPTHWYLPKTLNKKYRGSASAESYRDQGKTASHRAPEGDCYSIPYTGPVKNVLDNLTAGIKSACSYVGASNLSELREFAEFVEVTPNGARESGAHGRG